MLKLIIGVKGTGKTKTMIDMVNSALAVTKGDVVCVEKGTKLRYDIKPSARLIDVDEYMVSDAQSLYGFIQRSLCDNICFTVPDRIQNCFHSDSLWCGMSYEYGWQTFVELCCFN